MFDILEILFAGRITGNGCKVTNIKRIPMLMFSLFLIGPLTSNISFGGDLYFGKKIGEISVIVVWPFG